MSHTGWIPPEQRDEEQTRLTNEFHEQIRTFAAVAETTSVDEPDFVSIPKLYHDKHQKPIPVIWQTTGSCVGAGGGNCYIAAMFADVHFRGDSEEVKMPFFLYTYGIGRMLGGMRRRGSGSFGGAQARAAREYGILPVDFDGVPQPESRGRWLKYGQSTELEWSYSPRFPKDVDDLKAKSEPFAIENITKIESASEARQALAQGRPLTFASSFGASPRVVGDVSIGGWSRTWYHQMHGGSYLNHSDEKIRKRYGTLFGCQNQWGPRAHPRCPTASKWGQDGMFWIPERDFDRICQKGEVYAHSHTGGFPAREFKWTVFG
jgi:hypothetical protein